MFRDAAGVLQPGHIAIVLGVIAYLLWAAPTLVAAGGSRQTLRTLRPRQVWDFQRGQTAVRHATRTLVVVGSASFLIQAFVF